MSLGERLQDLWAGLKARAYGGPNDPERDERARPDEVIGALALLGGERVADIGSGGGYYTFRLARAVGPTGVVYAVDVDAGLLRRIAREAERQALANVRTVESSPDEPGLPEPVEMMFASNSYHHIPDRVGYFRRAARDLQPGGRIVIVEGHREGIARFLRHATDPDRIVDELSAAGYELTARHEFMAGSSFQIFRRRAAEEVPEVPTRHR